MSDVGLFFDLDNTLADSEPAHWRAWQLALEPYGVNLTWAHYEEGASGRNDAGIFDWLAAQPPNGKTLGDKKTILDAKRDLFVTLCAQNCPVDKDNIALIKNGFVFPLALVTSSPRKEVEAMLRPAGLMRSFRALVCGDDVKKFKPDPEPYLKAKEILGVAKGIAFEDSEHGEMSGRAAGLKVVHVNRPSSLPRLVRQEIARLRSG